jgi:hypothetical protein
MRPRSIALLAGAGAAVLTIAVGLALPASAAELLTNPGFETGTLSGWQCDASDSVTGTAPHTGSYTLNGNAGGDTAQCKQTVAVKPSTAYTFSGWVKGAYVFVGVTGGVDASTWTPGTNGAYSQLSVPFTTAAGQTTATVYVHGWYGQGAYTADDFSLSGPSRRLPPPLRRRRRSRPHRHPHRRSRPRPRRRRPPHRRRPAGRCRRTSSPATGRTSSTRPHRSS